MNVEVQDVGYVSILRPRGRVTIGSGDVQLRDAIEGSLAGGRSHLLLDLSGVSYMDSAGLGELVASGQRARSARAVIKLLKPTRHLCGLLEMTRVEEEFEIFDDEREALVSFSAETPRAC